MGSLLVRRSTIVSTPTTTATATARQIAPIVSGACNQPGWTGSATTGLLSDFTIYHSSRNTVWTFVKNMPGLLFWLYLPQHLLVNAMTTLVYAIHGQGRAALRGKRDALRALPRVLGERRRIQAARVASSGVSSAKPFGIVSSADASASSHFSMPAA